MSLVSSIETALARLVAAINVADYRKITTTISDVQGTQEGFIPALNEYGALDQSLFRIVDLPALTSPGSPPANKVRLSAMQFAGRTVPVMIDQYGLVYVVMPHLGMKQQGMLLPTTAAAFTSIGAVFSNTGTAEIKTTALTNVFTRMPGQLHQVTFAVSNAVSGVCMTSGSPVLVGGDAATRGGGGCMIRFGASLSTTLSTRRDFAGLANTTAAPTDVDPSTVTNIIGVGADAADTNFQIMHRGTGAITKIDTGFAKTSAAADQAYELFLSSPPGTTQKMGYLFRKLSTGESVSGEITTNLPTATTLLYPRLWSSVGGFSSTIGVACGGIYVDPMEWI